MKNGSIFWPNILNFDGLKTPIYFSYYYKFFITSRIFLYEVFKKYLKFHTGFYISIIFYSLKVDQRIRIN